MNSTIVTEHKCGSLSVGVDAADTALKCMLPGGENENGANGQQKGREGPNALAQEYTTTGKPFIQQRCQLLGGSCDGSPQIQHFSTHAASRDLPRCCKGRIALIQ